MHKDHATLLSFHSKQFWLARVFFIIYNMSDVEKFSKILTANCLLCVLNDLRRNCKYLLNLNGPRTKMVIRVACVASVSARVHRESWNAREQKARLETLTTQAIIRAAESWDVECIRAG